MDTQSLTRMALAGMMAGAFALTGCEKGTESNKTPAGITGAKTLAAFETECAKLNGTFKTHDCQAMNTCKGHSFSETNTVAAHDCQGHSTCKGASCVEP